PRRTLALLHVRLPGRFELEAKLVLSCWYDVLGFDAEKFASDVIVHVPKLAVLDEQGISARGRALAEQHALGPLLRDLDVCSDAVRAVEHLRRRSVRHRLRVRHVRVAVAWRRDLGLLADHTGEAAAVNWHDLVLAGLDVPGTDHRDQAIAVLVGDV